MNEQKLTVPDDLSAREVVFFWILLFVAKQFASNEEQKKEVETILTHLRVMRAWK